MITVCSRYGETFGQPQTYTLGANGVGAGGSASADWGTNLGTPTIQSGMTVSWSGTGAATTVTAKLAGSTPGMAAWGALNPFGELFGAYAEIFIDPNAPTVIPLGPGTSPTLASYEVLQSTGTSASTTWTSLAGASGLTVNPPPSGMNIVVSFTAAGLVTAGASAISPHYAWGTFTTTSGVTQVWAIRVSS
jgi:hypothetical protein